MRETIASHTWMVDGLRPGVTELIVTLAGREVETLRLEVTGGAR